MNNTLHLYHLKRVGATGTELWLHCNCVALHCCMNWLCRSFWGQYSHSRGFHPWFFVQPCIYLRVLYHRPSLSEPLPDKISSDSEVCSWLCGVLWYISKLQLFWIWGFCLSWYVTAMLTEGSHWHQMYWEQPSCGSFIEGQPCADTTHN